MAVFGRYRTFTDLTKTNNSKRVKNMDIEQDIKAYKGIDKVLGPPSEEEEIERYVNFLREQEQERYKNLPDDPSTNVIRDELRYLHARSVLQNLKMNVLLVAHKKTIRRLSTIIILLVIVIIILVSALI